VNTVLQHCYAVEKNSRLCNLGSVEKRKRLARGSVRPLRNHLQRRFDLRPPVLLEVLTIGSAV
jgi:hypothetical protein